MNSRERVLAAINHHTPDRPPRDIGSTTTTGINVDAYTALKKYLGLSNPEHFEYLSARALVARVEDEIIDRFGLDVLPIISKQTAIAPELNKNRAYYDRWGVERTLPEDGGHFYVSKPPLADVNRISDLNQYEWPEPLTDFSELGLQAKHLYETTDKALVLNLSIGFLHQAQFLRGYDNWLMDLASEPALAEAYMDQIIEIWIEEAEKAIEACRGYAHIVTYTDDIAFQNSPMMSMRMYRKLIKSRQKRVFDCLKKSDMKVFYHSCGSLVTMLDDFIDMGVDILNPVQVSAKGMDDTVELKRRWGKDVVFWGAIDTQNVLPYGSPADVRTEVYKRLNDLSPDGGYVLACVHDIQAEVSPENVCALFDAADEW
jgi:uroporphyrinogen decarboxylase